LFFEVKSASTKMSDTRGHQSEANTTPGGWRAGASEAYDGLNRRAPKRARSAARDERRERDGRGAKFEGRTRAADGTKRTRGKPTRRGGPMRFNKHLVVATTCLVCGVALAAGCAPQQ